MGHQTGYQAPSNISSLNVGYGFLQFSPLTQREWICTPRENKPVKSFHERPQRMATEPLALWVLKMALFGGLFGCLAAFHVGFRWSYWGLCHPLNNPKSWPPWGHGFNCDLFYTEFVVPFQSCCTLFNKVCIVSSIHRVLLYLLIAVISYPSVVYYDQLFGDCHLCITTSWWVLVIHWYLIMITLYGLR